VATSSGAIFTGARSGAYPFVLRARSLETGGVSAAQGTLHVRPFYAFDFYITPPRGQANPIRPGVQYDVRLENQGNTSETFDLSVRDPGEACAYQLSAERVQIAPGEVVEITLTVERDKDTKQITFTLGEGI